MILILRGDLKIVLRSPSGTVSNILDVRRADTDSRGYTNHQFLTVHMWDESPFGVWQLKIINKNRYFMDHESWYIFV